MASGGRKVCEWRCRGCLEATIPRNPRPFSLFGVEIVFEDAEFTAIACPQYGVRLAEVEELHSLLNTEPAVGLQLHDEAV